MCASAHTHPATVRRTSAEGHTIGTHSEDHPLRFGKLPIEKARWEIDMQRRPAREVRDVYRDGVNAALTWKRLGRCLPGRPWRTKLSLKPEHSREEAQQRGCSFETGSSEQQ